MKTEKNSVFKAFIALCSIITIAVLYILLIRPQKIVLEYHSSDAEKINFIYKTSNINPSIETLEKKAKEGKHIITVLLTPTHKLLVNYSYEDLLPKLKNCTKVDSCIVLSLETEKFMKKAKKRKDNNRKKSYNSLGQKKGSN